MTSMVPLRMRLTKDTSSSHNAYEDIWINVTPGSKFFCRPIRFEYTKENKTSTQSLVESINNEIKALSTLQVNISGRSIKVSFHPLFTMIDGKVANAITDITSTWQCNICKKKVHNFTIIPTKKQSIKKLCTMGYPLFMQGTFHGILFTSCL